MKCKICGKKLKMKKEYRYEIVQKPVGLVSLIEGTKVFEAFDCTECGCQNIVNVREMDRLKEIEVSE